MWHTLNKEEVLNRLDVDPSTGLKEDDARERLARYGKNEFAVEKGSTAITIFFRQFKDTLIIILLIATILSFLIGEVFDAGLIILIVIFSAGLGFLQEYKAEKAIEALKMMLSPGITVLRDGKEKEVATEELVPGDIVLLESGDRIPADARILESHSLMVDEASLTGESNPVEKESSPLQPEKGVTEQTNMVFAGTVVTYGRGKAIVVATGMDTELGKIAREVSSIEKEKTPLERRTEEIGRWLGILAFAICFAVAGLGIVRETIGGGISPQFILTMVMFAVALAVAAVPEALAAIVTGTLAIGMREMAKKNAFVRRMAAVETLGSVTVICSDKTGTITKGEMTVRKVYADGRFIEVSGVGYEPAGEFSPDKRSDSLSKLIHAGVLCNDSDITHESNRWSIKGDPTEAALLVLALKAGKNLKELRLKNKRIEEIPFSSERKLMTTIHTQADGIKTAYMKGAPEVVIQRCSHESRGERTLPLNEKAKETLLKIAESMAEEGLRVLAFATHRVKDSEDLETNMEFLGFAGMIDPPRKEAVEAVKVCKDIGIKPVMITGDHKLTAMTVARETGIYGDGDIALTGEELNRLEEEEFEAIVDRVSVYARVSPMDKLKIVRAWKKRGEVVAMTGDGVNDAPALKTADIGVAMGITGTEVSKEAADMVLADDNFATILNAIERGRWIYDNIKKYLTYLLRANIIEVIVLGGVVILKGPDYLPLLPPAILYINLLTDGLPALALGVSPPEPDIMERKPRDPEESVFSTDVKAFIFMALIIEAPLFFWAFFRSGDIITGRTDLFFLFVIIELVIALNFRSLRHSILKAPPHPSLLLSVVMSIGITILIARSPSIRESFGITLPDITEIEIVLLISLLVTASIEGIKKALQVFTK